MKNLTISCVLNDSKKHKEKLQKYVASPEFTSANKKLRSWAETQGSDTDCLIFDTCSDWCESALGEYNFLLVSVLRAISLEGSAPSDAVSTIKETWQSFLDSVKPNYDANFREMKLGEMIREQEGILKREEEDNDARERKLIELKRVSRNRMMLIRELKKEFFKVSGRSFR